MKAPAHMQPINPELVDTLVKASDTGWIPTDPDGKASMKVLFAGEESGQWAALFRWKKGYVAGPHKHLSPAHTFVIKGKLQVREGVLESGDYLYERNGMIHESTTALEDTEYVFVCDGPLVFYNESGALTGYLGWEELVRMQQAMPEQGAA